MTPPKIIGIAGTNGSGKDTIGKLLSEHYNYLFISVTDLLREELTRRGLELARENMRELSAEWRRESGLGVLVDKAKQSFDKVADQYEGVAMASLRNPGEADAVHELGGVVIWVDADPKIRYERIRINSAARGQVRQVDDDKSFAEFLADEEAEMHHPAGSDGATLSLSDVKQKSDLFIENDGQDLMELKAKLSNALGFSNKYYTIDKANGGREAQETSNY